MKTGFAQSVPWTVAAGAAAPAVAVSAVKRERFYEAAEKEYGGAAGKARMARAADGAAGDFVGIRFEGDRWNEMLVAPGDEVSLKMHARLVALWERSDVSELPKTGGAGTGAYVIAGVALIAIAGVGAAWYAVRRRDDGGGDSHGRDSPGRRRCNGIAGGGDGCDVAASPAAVQCHKT